ncbi:MAG: response regulator [bacterium]|nr:response regulator [bacterium]
MKDVTILTNNGVNVQQSLELFGDMEMYDETLTDFLDMSQEKLASLEKHRVANDMPNYAIEVHALKSDARYLGFMTLGDMAYESEMKSKAGDSAYVNENHPKILEEAKRVINLAETYLGRPLTTSFPGLATSVGQPVAPQAPVAPAGQPVAPQAPVAPAGQPVAPQAPVAPAGQPVAPQAPVAPAGQPVAPQAPVAPAGQPVAPQVPLMPAEQNYAKPAEPIIQTSESGSIQFFPSDNMNNIMDQSLSAINQATAAQTMTVPGVKQGIILIIDDSNLVANFVKKIFSANYDVLVANDGSKGIEMANDPNIRPKIKTCLVDLYMPNVDGFQVLDNFRENGIFVKTPVAVISGAEDTESIERAKSYPIIDILAKPFTDRDVKMCVEKCLAVYF